MRSLVHWTHGQCVLASLGEGVVAISDPQEIGLDDAADATEEAIRDGPFVCLERCLELVLKEALCARAALDTARPHARKRPHLPDTRALRRPSLAPPARLRSEASFRNEFLTP
jgi:hypothetical protein